MGMYKKIFEDYVKNNKNEDDLRIHLIVILLIN